MQTYFHRLGGLALAMMLLAPGVALANMDKDHKGMSVDQKVGRMQKRLALTDEQTTQVRSILELSHDATAADLKAIKERKEQTQQQIEALLTDDQKKEYAQMRKEYQKAHQKGFGSWFKRKHKDE